jgi:peptide/nickel transport system substrate-binding protein
MKTVSRTLLASLAVVLLAACGGDRGGTPGATREDAADAAIPEEQRYGGTAVVALGADITDINPLTSSDANSNQVQMYVLFTPVVHFDENLEPVPGLARTWELNEDGTELTFHLRDDIYWQDGVRTTAHDLKLAYDLARNPETAFPNSAFWTHYGDAVVPDSFTFRVALTPHAEYMDPWRTFFAVPRHVLGDVPPSQLRAHPFSSRSPVGNGPFRFAGRQAGQNWTFEAVEDYPQELGGRPYLDRLVIRVIPEATTRLTELLRGSVDYYVQVTPEQISRIEASGAARIVSFPFRSYTFVGWNQRRYPFEDARVRRALTMAINKESIVNGILQGHGDIIHTSVPPLYWQADTSIGTEELAHDPERARALLREAGWEDRDGDGVLEDEQGRPFRFTIKTNAGNQERKDLTEVIQANLRRIGVDAQLQLVEFNSLIETINDVQRRDFDAVVMGWVAEFKLDDANLLHCDMIDQPYQWVGHCSPELDRFLDTLQLIPDREDAIPVWHDYQRQLVEEQPYTYLYAVRRLEGVHQRLRNVHPDARADLVGVARWFIHPEMRTR